MPASAVQNTDNSGRVIYLKLKDGQGSVLPVYIGAPARRFPSGFVDFGLLLGGAGFGLLCGPCRRGFGDGLTDWLRGAQATLSARLS